MIVYICAPYAAPTKIGRARNELNAADYCYRVAREGHTPIATHLLFPAFLSDEVPEERKLALDMGKNLLRKCDEVWVFGDRISSGMRSEIMLAQTFMIPVRYIGKEADHV